MPSAVAVDSSGNIIVTGGGKVCATIKYSPSGVPLWTDSFDTPAHPGDKATALAVASNGNIFVTGRSYLDDYEDASPQYVTIAYTGEGLPLWTNLYGAEGIEDSFGAMALDGSGNVVGTGFSQ